MMNSPQGRPRARFIATLAAIPFVAFGVLGAAQTASATPPPDHKVTFCHATGSATNPYVIITTDNIAWAKAHLSHQDGRDKLFIDGVCGGNGGYGSGGSYIEPTLPDELY